ncbi:hypothetical protein D9611_010593 [Ephemerocybe angulata]|uniref:Uncharacterized protein n=1 Tax=Ephemerocybe angulata TaxID=980116 RepID=A0A8H5BXG6_9AGAR|nr:hypothetical protein D9611_010593 [Tulosesus angulatus]
MSYPVQGMLRAAVNLSRTNTKLLPLNIFVVAALVTVFFSTRYAVLTASALVLTFSSLMTGLIVVSGTESHAGYPQRALNDGESVVEQWIGGWMQRVEMEAHCSAGTKIRRR